MRKFITIAGWVLSITLCAGFMSASATGYDHYVPGTVHRDIQAWKLPPAEAEAITRDHRLVGLGCGPNRITGTAREEDEFPAPCYAIGTPEEMCPPEPTFEYIPTVAECAAYLGEGW